MIYYSESSRIYVAGPALAEGRHGHTSLMYSFRVRYLLVGNGSMDGLHRHLACHQGLFRAWLIAKPTACQDEDQEGWHANADQEGQVRAGHDGGRKGS